MGFVSRIKLRYQVIILVSLAIMMMVVIQVFYYFNSQALLQRKAGEYFSNYIKQLEGQFIFASKDIENIATKTSYSQIVQKYLLEKNSITQIQLRPFIVEKLISIASANSNVTGVKITGLGGEVLLSSSDTEYYRIYKDIITDYDLGRQVYQGAFYTTTYRDEFKGKSYYAYIMPIISVQPDDSYKTRLGEIIILCNVSALNLADKNILPEDSLLLIIDKDGYVISGDRAMMNHLNAISELTKSRIREKDKILYNNHEYWLKSVSIEKVGWNIICLIPHDILIRDMLPIRNLGILIAGVSILILCALGVILIGSIFSPISNLIREVDKLGQNDTKYRLKRQSNNEIGKLARNINRMLERIEIITQRTLRDRDKILQAELAKTKAELSTLQSQINPHFLYNTLECMRSIALEHGIPEIVKISTAMARIFRYSIKGNNIVTIRDEMECVKNYFDIIAIRYDGRFKLGISIDEGLMKENIIKMVLQPIVENAVYHGLENRKQKGVVEVRGYKDEAGRIIIRIKDNGKGMEESDVRRFNDLMKKKSGPNPMEDRRSIGLLNIARRLRLMFGESSIICITSSQNVGTTVEICLPA